jgi:hypothetical protein
LHSWKSRQAVGLVEIQSLCVDEEEDVDDFPDEDDMTGVSVRRHHAAAAASAAAAYVDDDDTIINHPSAKHLGEIPELLFPQRA